MLTAPMLDVRLGLFIAALTCGAKKVYGFDPLIEKEVANDDRFVRYNWKIDNFAVGR